MALFIHYTARFQPNTSPILQEIHKSLFMLSTQYFFHKLIIVFLFFFILIPLFQDLLMVRVVRLEISKLPIQILPKGLNKVLHNILFIFSLQIDFQKRACLFYRILLFCNLFLLFNMFFWRSRRALTIRIRVLGLVRKSFYNFLSKFYFYIFWILIIGCFCIRSSASILRSGYSISCNINIFWI